MTTHKLSLLVLAGFVAMGCGGGGAASATKSSPVLSGGSAPPAPTEAEESGGSAPSGEATASVQAAPAPSAPSAGAARAEPSRKRALESRDEDAERPGLGTSWGETRTSRVSTAPFVRENPDRPFAAASIFYNDAEGVRAMARRSGISHFADGGVHIAGGAVTVRLLDSNGRPLEGLMAGGRNYVVGQDGERYMIQIRNETRQRFEAVATVDGLDVVDGRPGALSKRGYIVNPFSTVEIDGFRQSFEEVAAFRFGSVRGSYAAQKGDGRNVGVIGVAFFEEAGTRWSDLEIDRRHDADPFPARFASPVQRF